MYEVLNIDKNKKKKVYITPELWGGVYFTPELRNNLIYP